MSSAVYRGLRIFLVFVGGALGISGLEAAADDVLAPIVEVTIIGAIPALFEYLRKRRRVKQYQDDN